MTKIFLSVAFALSLFLGGCAKSEVISPVTGSQDQSGSESPPLSATNPPVAFRSDIDFSAIVWPANMTNLDRRALELALNISGSFEGLESWITISNNSDKQGMSLGLLSQNFGSGTLQPLLIEMRDHHPEIMSLIFSPAHLISLYAMLVDWSSQTSARSFAESPRVSMLDMFSMANSAAGSVAWAVKNIYSNKAGTVFIKQWKSEFQTLAITPEYKNLQFGEALTMHEAAKAYALQTGVSQLRSYLMMFDVVDQNGYMHRGDFVDYQTYLQANPNATATERLSQLVELRVRHVNPVYADDVRSRKMAIVNGQGRVHSVERNLEVQYDFSRLESY